MCDKCCFHAVPVYRHQTSTVPNSHSPLKNNDGFVLLWTLLWLAALTLLSWATVTYAMPRFEQKQRTAVMLAVAKATNQPMSLEINGFQATLSGNIPDDSHRQSITEALGPSNGIFKIRDRFRIVEPIAVAVERDLSDAIAPSPAQLTAPSLKIRLAGDVLTVEGNLAPTDDALPVIQQAMDDFQVDIVSNEITSSENTAPSAWLNPVKQFLPSLALLKKPTISVEQQQFVLSGIAPDVQTHDSIVHEALARFSQYALVERITIEETANASQK